MKNSIINAAFSRVKRINKNHKVVSFFLLSICAGLSAINFFPFGSSGMEDLSLSGGFSLFAFFHTPKRRFDKNEAGSIGCHKMIMMRTCSNSRMPLFDDSRYCLFAV